MTDTAAKAGMPGVYIEEGMGAAAPPTFVPIRIEVSRDWLRDMVAAMPALAHGRIIGAEDGQQIELLAADDVGPDEAIITTRDGREGTTTISQVLAALRLDGVLAEALMERRRLLLEPAPR